MSNVRLHRAYCTIRLACNPADFKGTRQSRNFDRISKLSPGAMSFDVTDGPVIYSGLLEGPSDHLGLCNWIGDGVAIGLASMIDGCCLDHRVDLIPICFCLCQWFEEDSSHSLTGYIAIGT